VGSRGRPRLKRKVEFSCCEITCKEINMKMRSCCRSILGTLLLVLFWGTAASAAMPTYHGKSADQWLEMLGQPDDDIRGQAFMELTQADRSGGEMLLAFLGSPNPGLRTIAVMGLNHMAPSYPESIPGLAEASLDVNLNIRYWALSALRKYGDKAGSAVPNIIRALETYQGQGPELEGPVRYYADARARAAEALGGIGPAAKDALPALEKALQDPSGMVREAAKLAIEMIRMPSQIAE
jgi:HEAT repeat protein